MPYKYQAEDIKRGRNEARKGSKRKVKGMVGKGKRKGKGKREGK